MSEHIGDVYEVNGDRVWFLLRKDTSNSISFGEILKIKSSNRTFYVRVTNMQAKSMFDMKEIYYESEGNEAIKPYSNYIPVEATIFLEEDNGKIRSQTFIPSYMDKVLKTDQTDHGLLKLAGDLTLGKLRCGGELTLPVGVNVESFPLHFGIFGMTGSGKTNTELLLNALIMDNPRCVGVVLDFHGELLTGKRIGKGLRDHPSFHMKCAYYGSEEIKVGNETIWTSHLPLLFSRDDLTNAQWRSARQLDKKLGRQWISKVKEEGLPKLEGESSSSMKALLRKLNDLPEEIFIPNSNISFIPGIVDNVRNGVSCLIDLSGLTLSVQKKVACLVAYNVAHEYESLWKNDYELWKTLPILLITLEEAHEFLDPDPKKRSFFSDLTLKYRKYNVGLNIVTPRPSRIDLNVFAELWTKIIMKTTLAKDREFITKNTPYLEYSNMEVKLLDTGEALLVSEPQLRFAVPIKIIHYPEYLETLEKTDYNLPPSECHKKMDEQLTKIKESGKTLMSSLWKEGRLSP